VVHLFDGEPDQVRGITPFISILKVGRQFDQLADATLTASIIQAIFAAVFRSAAKPEEVMAALQTNGEQDFKSLITSKAEWYDKADISLGTNGKIAHLFPGDELEFLRSEHPNSTYEAFTKVLMREMSRPCAISYGAFSGDNSGDTYSSIRMTTADNWPKVIYRRKHLPGRLHQQAYEAWTEEAIEKNLLPFPGGVAAFMAQKDAACRADWRGPPKPQADDTKAAAAHETWSKLGVMTDEAICADLGTDVDDVYEGRARERNRRQELGLPEPAPSGSAAAIIKQEAQAPAKAASPSNG
jgi:lambda family phage portal protein